MLEDSELILRFNSKWLGHTGLQMVMIALLISVLQNTGITVNGILGQTTLREGRTKEWTKKSAWSAWNTDKTV